MLLFCSDVVPVFALTKESQNGLLEEPFLTRQVTTVDDWDLTGAVFPLHDLKSKVWLLVTGRKKFVLLDNEII